MDRNEKRRDDGDRRDRSDRKDDRKDRREDGDRRGDRERRDRREDKDDRDRRDRREDRDRDRGHRRDSRERDSRRHRREDRGRKDDRYRDNRRDSRERSEHRERQEDKDDRTKKEIKQEPKEIKGWVDPFSNRSEDKDKAMPKPREFDPMTGEERPREDDESNDKVTLPSFEVSGKLAADTNTFKGVVIKYNQPDEAAVPKLKWRLYPMKGDDVLQPFYIHRQSAYLVGRNRKIADFPVDHPSCSSQHAVIQYRRMPYEKNGVPGHRTLPYIIDLSSANGTFLNGEKIEPQRYYELKEKDSLKFGFSSREYIVLHELSADGIESKDVDIEMDDDEADEVDLEGAEEKMAKTAGDYF